MSDGASRREAAGPKAGLPRTAASVAAAWILPGAGHVVLGRVRRGVVFAAIVLSSFGLGVAHDGRFALRNDREVFLTSIQVLANVGVGPLDALFRSAVYGSPVYALPAAAGREHERLQNIFRDRVRSPDAIYGTAYLWTAGLMNLLLILDCWDIGRGRKS